MLSRFSKLPGVLGNVFHNNKEYPQEVIDSAVAEIKLLGRASSNNEDTLQNITKILLLMKKYSDSLHVQRVACHAISNLAMQVVIARWIVQKGGFQLIRKCLLKFEEDYKLCWLASSAIWNLARPPANRAHIGSEGVRLMINVLKKHHDKEKVTNTTIGALSNLSLCDSLKLEVAQESNLKLIVEVLGEYSTKRSVTVLTSGAGLIANLAVSDEFAETVVNMNALPIVLQLLKWERSGDDTLHRNACAALNNMVTAARFVDSFLEHKGVEQVYEFLQSNDKELYNNLLENCLVNMEVDVGQQTTSLHLCALHGKEEILKNLVSAQELVEFDATDSKNMTALDYAISAKHVSIIKFLSKCGATKFQQNILADNSNEKEREQIERAIEEGRTIRKQIIKDHETTFVASLPAVPVDICKVMVEFNSVVSMLQAVKQYE